MRELELLPVIIVLAIACAIVAGCTTINVTSDGDVRVDAHKEIVVADPSVEVPLL